MGEESLFNNINYPLEGAGGVGTIKPANTSQPRLTA